MKIVKITGWMLMSAGAVELLVNNYNSFTGGFIGVQNGNLNLIAFLSFLIGLILVNSYVESDLEKAIKPAPGKGINGSYILLKDIIERGTIDSNKVNLKVIGNQIYRDGRPIQGLILKNDYVEFIGYHFTSHEAAKIIKNSRALEIKNSSDPYIYLLEPLSYRQKEEGQIRHVTGASSARECVIVKVRYPIDRLYIKVDKNKPTHFAVDGDITYYDLIKRKGEKISVKSLDEL